jgi:hypothetical protein
MMTVFMKLTRVTAPAEAGATPTVRRPAGTALRSRPNCPGAPR